MKTEELNQILEAHDKWLRATSTPKPRTAEMEAIFRSWADAYRAQRKAELESKTLAQLEVEFSNRAVL